MSERVRILGISIDPVTKAQAVDRILQFLNADGQHHVMTPNSEMLVEASKNPVFKQVLLNAALNIPDSAGLLYAARWTGQQLPERVAGVDAVQDVCANLDMSHPVFLLGGEEGVAEKAAAALMQKNPSLLVCGVHAGTPKPEDAQGIIDMINAAKPHLLLVAYGAPRQDVWIHEHLSQMLSVKVAIGVGGTFDFLAGKTKRAPLIFRSLHLEWLWRLVLEPWRWKRVVTAVVVFPGLVLLRKQSRR